MVTGLGLCVVLCSLQWHYVLMCVYGVAYVAYFTLCSLCVLGNLCLTVCRWNRTGSHSTMCLTYSLVCLILLYDGSSLVLRGSQRDSVLSSCSTLLCSTFREGCVTHCVLWVTHCDTLCTVSDTLCTVCDTLWYRVCDTLCLFNLLLIAVIAAAIVNRPTFSHYLPPIHCEWEMD